MAAVFKATEMFLAVSLTNSLQIQRSNAEEQTFLHPYPECSGECDQGLEALAKYLQKFTGSS